jgi:hypothetical protein
MNDRELQAAAVGIITYCSILQTGEPPKLDEENQIIETAAILENEILEATLEILSEAELDGLELYEAQE